MLTWTVKFNSFAIILIFSKSHLATIKYILFSKVQLKQFCTWNLAFWFKSSGDKQNKVVHICLDDEPLALQEMYAIC